MEKFRRGHLPEELVIEILLRLPVESLVRSKAVCKYWYNVITSSDFIKNHFNHRRHSNHARIFVYHIIPSPTFEARFAVFSDESLARLHHDFDYLRIPHILNCIVGPVNGLFLLCCGKHMRPYDYPLALLNPATRELRPLIVPAASQEPHLWSSSHTFGFGFDPLTNDFKVVACWDFHDRRTGESIGLINIAVYSVANDSWKHLCPLPMHNYSPCAHSGTAYFNGACHWLLGDFDSGYSVLSFDISGEVLREINGPQNTLSKLAFLFVYNNDSLAMFLCAYDSSRVGSIDVLVMKEEGCWTKHLTVDVSLLGVIQPLGLWKNSKLFLEIGTKPPYRTSSSAKLVLYDPVIHETRELGIQYSDFGYPQVFRYEESLVSLKGKNKDWGKYSFSDLIQDFCVQTAEKTEDYFWCEQCMVDRSRCTCGDNGDLVEEEDEDNNDHNEYEEAEQQQN